MTLRTAYFSDFLQVVKPKYLFLKLTPSYSIRNNQTHKIARAINSIYKNVTENIKKEEVKLIKVLGKEFMIGTKYSFHVNSKVSFFVYIEKKKAEFYFIVPEQHLSVIKEKIRDVWQNVTIATVEKLPTFTDKATKMQLFYEKEDALSLSVDKRNNELLNSKLNIIDVLEEGDKVGVFYNFIPTSQFSWPATYKNTIIKVKNGAPVERNKVGLTYLFKSLVNLLSILTKDIGAAFSDQKKIDENINALTKALEGVSGKNTVGEATFKKGADTVLNTQILVLSESGNELRQRNNIKSLAQSFDTISQDNTLRQKAFKGNFNPIHFTIRGAEVNKISSNEASNFIAIPGREILESYNFIEKIQTNETQVPEDLRKGVMCIGENTFRGIKQMTYLSTDKEYQYLMLVLIGPSRAGKSTLIQNLTVDALNAGETTILFDFVKNNELSEEVASVITNDKVLRIETSDINNLQGLGFNEFKPSADPFTQYDNAKKQTKQLLTLINAINTDDKTLAPKMERYLSAAALVVFIKNGSFKNVFEVLQDHNKRRNFVKDAPSTQKENLEEYLMTLNELDEIDKEGKSTGTKYHLITGVIDRLQKLKQNAYMELMLKESTKNNFDLVNEIQKPQLITIKMPESMFMTSNEKDIYTTYWISKIWLSLQLRANEIKGRGKLTKVNIVIDELYQVENTERYITEKLSQIAKFNAKIIISAHYINQLKHIREELRSSNASYMLISGCDSKNYTEFKSELYPFIEEDLLNLPRYHSLNIIKNNDGHAKFITKLPKPIL